MMAGGIRRCIARPGVHPPCEERRPRREPAAQSCPSELPAAAPVTSGRGRTPTRAHALHFRAPPPQSGHRHARPRRPHGQRERSGDRSPRTPSPPPANRPSRPGSAAGRPRTGTRSSANSAAAGWASSTRPGRRALNRLVALKMILAGGARRRRPRSPGSGPRPRPSPASSTRTSSRSTTSASTTGCRTSRWSSSPAAPWPSRVRRPPAPAPRTRPRLVATARPGVAARPTPAGSSTAT